MKIAILIFVLAASEEGGQLTVDVGPLRSAGGVVHCNLWKTGDGFPSEYKKAAVTVDAAGIKDGKAQCIFTGVAAGSYAVSVFHDENGDGKLETGVFGIPKEPVGVSNNATGTFGPPKFEDAKFKFDGKALTLSVSPK